MEFKYNNVASFWKILKLQLLYQAKKGKIHSQDFNEKILYSMKFTNAQLRITHLLIIHLKEQHMLELMKLDSVLLNAIYSDTDEEGNTCAHIALIYDKQKVLDQLLTTNPSFCDQENDKGHCIADVTERMNRTSRMTEASMTMMMRSSTAGRYNSVFPLPPNSTFHGNSNTNSRKILIDEEESNLSRGNSNITANSMEINL
mmetsp:Transcript_269/g.266  ORF Transcript_269/g.266 Transcript_269/m.266 type:complete len:201 (+) Transcript_269:238-840(+)